MPAEPVAPVAGSPIVGVVPPPVGVVVPDEIGHTLDVADLQTRLRGFLVVRADEVAGFHQVGDGSDDLLRIGVFPVFGLVGVADHQNTVGEIEGLHIGEVGLLVVVRVDQIVLVKPGGGWLFLARNDSDGQQYEQ